MAADYLANCRKMIITAEQLRSYGFSVYVPCLDIVYGLVIGGLAYADYFENSQPWLMAADAVFFTPGYEHSSGCRNEWELASSLNILIYTEVGQLLGQFGTYDIKRHTYFVPEYDFHN